MARKSKEGKLQLKVTLTQEEIALMIGSSRETVSRVLSEFKREDPPDQGLRLDHPRQIFA